MLKGHSGRAVVETDHTNSEIRLGFVLFGFMLIVVEMKFTAPRMYDTLPKVGRRWLGIQMLRRVQFLLREKDRLFILSLHRFLLFC
jgi:hypothetical protein